MKTYFASLDCLLGSVSRAGHAASLVATATTGDVRMTCPLMLNAIRWPTPIHPAFRARPPHLAPSRWARVRSKRTGHPAPAAPRVPRRRRSGRRSARSTRAGIVSGSSSARSTPATCCSASTNPCIIELPSRLRVAAGATSSRGERASTRRHDRDPTSSPAFSASHGYSRSCRTSAPSGFRDARRPSVRSPAG